MKNTFKIFGLMLLAGTLVLSSCKDDEETTPGVNPETGKTQFTITATSNNDDWGTVSGGGTYDTGSTVTLTATPKEGYKFVNWNTGATNNPLTFAATENATYTANFDRAGGAVTVGNESWDPQYINAQMASNAMMISFAKVSSNAYPICQIVYSNEAGVANGTFNGNPTMQANDEGNVSIGFGNPRVWYFEAGTWDLQSNTGETIHTGDWWGKTVTLSISNLDATAMTADVVVNAELAHVTEMLNDAGQLTTIDFNDVTSKSLSANFPGQQFTAATKSLFGAKKAIATLAR